MLVSEYLTNIVLISDLLVLQTLIVAVFSNFFSPDHQFFNNILFNSTQLTLLIITIHQLTFLITSWYTQLWYPISISAALILLASIITFIGYVVLTERYLNINLARGNTLLVFIWLTIYMTLAQNVFEMFLYFELIFLPSTYYVYNMAYINQGNNSILYLVSWTFTGSLLCLFGFCYLYSLTGTFSLDLLSSNSLSINENRILSAVFFVGFGINIPVWPFYYWLTNVHVDAPTGFSIFLSGFLVNTAFFCFCSVLPIIVDDLNVWIFGLVCLVTLYDSSCRMWETVDIKKVVALCTVQEMSLLVLLALLAPHEHTPIVALFAVFHGIISACFFLFVEYIYKICGTSNLTQLGGLCDHRPEIETFIWVGLLIFSGLPLFINFYIELEILQTLFTNMGILYAIYFLLSIYLGIVSVFNHFLGIMYGSVRSLNYQNIHLFAYTFNLFGILCIVASASLLFFV